MVAFRDLMCAEKVGEMAKLGYFDEEFVTYGCAFWQDGHIKYLASGKNESVEDFLIECALKDWYPTPVSMHLDRCKVAAGEREDIRQKTKLDMIRSLRKLYNRAFFDALATIAQTPHNDKAQPYFSAWQKDLEGCYDEMALKLYEELARLSLRRKVLTKSSFLAITAWLEDMRSQMADDAVVKEQNSRTFAGFASRQADGALKYYVNAQLQSVNQRQRQAVEQGLEVTPVLAKTYWFPTENLLFTKRQEFENLLKTYLDETYMARLQTINTLPTELNAALYEQQLKVVEAQCSTEAIAAFRSYGSLWGAQMR